MASTQHLSAIVMMAFTPTILLSYSSPTPSEACFYSMPVSHLTRACPLKELHTQASSAVREGWIRPGTVYTCEDAWAISSHCCSYRWQCMQDIAKGAWQGPAVKQSPIRIIPAIILLPTRLGVLLLSKSYIPFFFLVFLRLNKKKTFLLHIN